MDRKSEKSGHQKVLRRLAKLLKEIGFDKHKTTYFLRQKNSEIQYIHFHKFTFAPEFRVHLGIKSSDDISKTFYLNGLSSDAYRDDRKYNFRYHKTEDSIDRCAENLFRFCHEIGEEWLKENATV